MTQTNGRPAIRDRRDARLPYDEWVESIGVPIHRGYFIEDARNIEVGPWEERECNAAFIQLAGRCRAPPRPASRRFLRGEPLRQ